MKQRGYRPLTIRQKCYELKRYFGTPSSFQNADTYLDTIQEYHRKADIANRINSILHLLPSLKPTVSVYKEFRKNQKTWNEKKREYYNSRDNGVQDGWEKLRKDLNRSEEQMQENRGTKEELKCIRRYILYVLYVNFPQYIGRSVEFRTLQLRKDRTKAGEQNYVTESRIILNNYKKSGKKESDGSIRRLKDGAIVLQLPQELKRVIRRMRKLTKDSYIFGGCRSMSQPGFSLMQKRILGYSTNELRKMVVQHREGITKRHMQEVAQKMGNTVGTILGHYS